MEINYEAVMKMIKWHNITSLYQFVKEPITIDSPSDTCLAHCVAWQMIRAYNQGREDALKHRDDCEQDILCGNGQYGGCL